MMNWKKLFVLIRVIIVDSDEVKCETNLGGDHYKSIKNILQHDRLAERVKKYSLLSSYYPHVVSATFYLT